MTPTTLPALRAALSVVPITIGEARRFVEAEHSHHHAPLGGLFACGVAAGDRLCCVAVVSRPVSRALDAVPTVAEVTRVASDRTPHAASMCLAAATRGGARARVPTARVVHDPRRDGRVLPRGRVAHHRARDPARRGARVELARGTDGDPSDGQGAVGDGPRRPRCRRRGGPRVRARGVARAAGAGARRDAASPAGSGVARLPALDGLRAVAILAVLICHASGALGGWWSTSVALWEAGGTMGVDVFFVLSGYLITAGLLRSHGQRGALAAFWRRRAARILPLYAVTLAAIVAVGSRWYAGDIDVYMPRDWLPLIAAMGGNVPSVVGEYPGRLLTPLWSLAVEEQFYLAWPLVVLGCSRSSGAVCAGAGILGAVAFRAVVGHGAALYFATPARLDQLLTGALLAYALDTPRGAALCDALLPRARMLAAVVLAVCVATPGGVLRTHHREWSALAPLALSLAVAVVLHALLTQGSRALESRVLVAIGRVSFAGYLCHELVALAARRVLPRSWPLECRALAWGAAVWALAWVLTACVGRPVGRWITGAGKAP